MLGTARPCDPVAHPWRRTAVFAIVCAAMLEPTASAAPTRTEDERLLSLATAPAQNRLGSTLAMSRGSKYAFALAGAPAGGTGMGAVEAFQHLPGVGWGGYPPATQAAAAGGPCACPVDIEMLRWFGEELGVLAYRETSTDTDLRWWVPTGAGNLAPSVAGVPVESVAIYGDTLVVGQPTYSTNKGRILIFERGDDGFVLVATFVGTPWGRLGTAVGVGPSLVVAGAPDAGLNGVVRTYVRAGRWTPWLTISSPLTNQTGAKFGAALALSLEGDLLAVGSPYADKLTVLPGGTAKPDIGAVYLFEPSYLSWELTALLRPTEATSGDTFGSSVALHRDVVVAGSPREDVPQFSTGAAYVFEHLGSSWRETLRLADSAPQVRAFLGGSVAVGDLGVMAGAPGYDGNGVYDQGAVLFYGGIEQDLDND